MLSHMKMELMYKFLPLLLIFAAVIFGYFYLPIRREVAYTLHISGDTTTSCCNVADIEKSNGNFDENANLAMFDGQVIDYPKTSLAAIFNNPVEENTSVLGTTNSAGQEKWIEVNLEEQHLYAHEGDKVVMDFPISSGRWFPTPTGTFNIWYKTRYQSMVGGNPALGTYYNLPNVPNNMFFYSGFALHGAYWHNNFGHPMSHGCVNEPLADAAKIFEWAGPVLPSNQNAIRATADNPGTRVWVH